MTRRPKKDPSLCWDCQSKSINYDTTTTGMKTKRGLCRECYERKAARGSPSPFRKGRYRSDEMKENTHETKYGIDR